MKRGALLLITGALAVALTGGLAYAYWTDTLEMQCRMTVVYPADISVSKKTVPPDDALAGRPAAPASAPQTSPETETETKPETNPETKPEKNRPDSSETAPADEAVGEDGTAPDDGGGTGGDVSALPAEFSAETSAS